jgi:dTMP kinase
MPFVTLEGVEGSGKSTQARLLADVLGVHGLVTREPGGTTLGASIRELLLRPGPEPVAPAAELLLYFADRAQHVSAVLQPALAAGCLVVSDRYVDSSLAYQGHGRGLRRDLMLAVAELATGGLQPELTLLFDLPVEIGLQRVGRRGGHDRLEAEALAFHERVRAGYLALAAEQPTRFVRLDATQRPDALAAQVQRTLRARGLWPAELQEPEGDVLH